MCGVSTTLSRRQQRAVATERLILEHVEPGPSDLPRAQGVDQRRFVDQPAASRVDEIGRGLHGGEGRRADHVLVLGSEPGVQRDEIGAGEQIVQWRVGDAEAALFVFREPMTRGVDHPHPERVGPRRDRASDLAEADDPQPLAVEPAEIALSEPVVAHLARRGFHLLDPVSALPGPGARQCLAGTASRVPASAGWCAPPPRAD